MNTYISRIILFVRDLPRVADFYQKHFGFAPIPTTEKGWLELATAAGGCTLALHQAAAAAREGGQSQVKIVFGVADVHSAKEELAAQGLRFGKVYEVDGFAFANARDPEGNRIQISSRGIM